MGKRKKSISAESDDCLNPKRRKLDSDLNGAYEVTASPSSVPTSACSSNAVPAVADSSGAVSAVADSSGAVPGLAISSDAVPSDAVSSDALSTDSVSSDAVSSDAVLSDAVSSDAIEAEEDLAEEDSAFGTSQKQFSPEAIRGAKASPSGLCSQISPESSSKPNLSFTASHGQSEESYSFYSQTATETTPGVVKFLTVHIVSITHSFSYSLLSNFKP